MAIDESRQSPKRRWPPASNPIGQPPPGGGKNALKTTGARDRGLRISGVRGLFALPERPGACDPPDCMPLTTTSRLRSATDVSPCDAKARSSEAARRLRIALFAAGLALAVPEEGVAESELHYKYQDYREDSDRIRVQAHYASARVAMGTKTRLEVEGVIDTITGATPTGQPAPAGSDQVPLSTLVETRTAVVAEIAHDFGDASARVEYARSNENDYLSNGLSAGWIQRFNKKNTELHLGFSYIDDDITPDFLAEPGRKISRDALVGVTQVLDPHSTLTVNYVRGLSTGLHSDPYKLVQKTVEIVPGFALPLTFAERRPGRRSKDIVFVQWIRFFEKARGSLDASARHYADGHGIRSGTLDLAWFQRIGAAWVVRPAFRYYRQGAADFYFPDLDRTPIVPTDAPADDAPFYSSDYRLSAFAATTLGLKVVHTRGDRWAVDFAYERYEMRGRDATSRSAYIGAHIFTVGARLWF